jgi:serine/threonine-protein kinase RsbT
VSKNAPEKLRIDAEADVVAVRRAVRRLALELRFSLVAQTKLVTAASELARNALEHGGGGRVTLETVENGRRSGVQLVFEDRGPGIVDPDTALRDGFSTGRGLGLGLGGARRLVHEFDLSSEPGGGTRVRVVRWK